MALLLRVKSKNGQHTLKDMTLNSTVDDLRNNVSLITEISSDTLRILKDFPPKPMDLSDGTALLQDLNFKSGDVLIVEEDPSAKMKRETANMEKVLQDFVAQADHSQGILMRQVVPANNSCLFTSVNFVMEGKLDLEVAGSMREQIAAIVMSDEETYSEAFLGKPNMEYCAWIMNNESWGGAIELSILSTYYGCEIAAVDTQYTRVNKFGEDMDYKERVFLIYDGIHYDPLYMDSTDPQHPQITKFPTSNEGLLTQALQLAAEAKASRQYTDVHKFTLRCLVCQKALTGQTEARSHAKETGHINFGEY